MEKRDYNGMILVISMRTPCGLFVKKKHLKNNFNDIYLRSFYVQNNDIYLLFFFTTGLVLRVFYDEIALFFGGTTFYHGIALFSFINHVVFRHPIIFSSLF